MRILILTSIILLITGCDDKPLQLTKIIEVGEAINIEEIELKWNDNNIRSRVLTTRAVITIRGVASIIKGERLFIQEYSDGRQSLCRENSSKCRSVYR